MHMDRLAYSAEVSNAVMSDRGCKNILDFSTVNET